MISKKVIEKFQNLTGYGLAQYLQDTNKFFKDDVSEIVNFFSGRNNFLDKERVKELNRLAEHALIITDFFYYKKGVMNTVDYWELLEGIETIKTKLNYFQNISKYLRSSIINGVTRAGVVFDYTLKSGETLEQASKNFLEENDYENEWTRSAIENDLKEIDWDIKGSTSLKLRKQLFQTNLVTSMIDNTIGERIYGRDIKRLLTFQDNDLEVLGYRETVEQTTDILSTLSKNDIPEFPNLGLNANLYKGQNYSQLNYKSIARELKRTFASDDLFKDFEIKDIKFEEGDIFIEYKIDTKYELTIIKNIGI